jgi:integrase
MARAVNRLSALFVKSVIAPGRYADGNRVAPGGSKQWTIVFRRDGKWREMGLGGVSDIPLKRARELADQHRQTIAEGGDPIAERRAQRSKTATIPTFGELADQVLASLKEGFKNDKHIAQWEMTLREYAAPLRLLRVDRIMVHDVEAVLKPVWSTKRETASRLRGRIEKIFDAAIAKGYRKDANPARWKGNLDCILPRDKQVRGHHTAMPFRDVPTLMARLRDMTSVSARALEFTILTAARTGETLGAGWSEIDLAGGIWTVPAERMKAGKLHRVPLSARAMEILEEMSCLRADGKSDGVVFPGRGEKGLSNMSLTMVLRRLKLEPEPTVHGFRSSFRDWAGEATHYPREVAEAALAHTVGDKVEQAYRRADALEKRRSLMGEWERFASKPVQTLCPQIQDLK